jgi:hypothetical protein
LRVQFFPPGPVRTTQSTGRSGAPYGFLLEFLAACRLSRTLSQTPRISRHSDVVLFLFKPFPTNYYQISFKPLAELSYSVTPAKAGVQKSLGELDSGFRRNDVQGLLQEGHSSGASSASQGASSSTTIPIESSAIPKKSKIELYTAGVMPILHVIRESIIRTASLVKPITG